jgi:hypothetical protein
MRGIDGRSSIFRDFVWNEGGGRNASPGASKLKAPLDGVKPVLLFAQADLLGRAERLATDAFGNLLDFAAGLEERCDLIVDRFAGLNGWSWLCFAGGCFYTHGGH